MAKKAKLDILEIAPEEPVAGTPQDEPTIEQVEEERFSGEQTGGDFRSKVLKWVYKPLFWIILLAFTGLGLTAGILISFYQSMDADAPAVQQKQAVSATARPEGKQGALFEGMVVDQKDEKGNVRIVFCDVVLELENQKTASAIDGDRIDVRSVIYAVLKREPAQEGLSPEGRGRIKEKLKNELKGLLGENSVKEVYFTRYELD
jgi:flagellar basal body-associated protein FliL